MRKQVLLPAVAVLGGAVGFALRRWGLETAFEADTGLPIPGAPATAALIVLSVVVAAVLLLLSVGEYPDLNGYDGAFQAKGNTLYATVGVISAFGGAAAGLFMIVEFVQGSNQLYTRLIVAVMAVISAGCIFMTVYNNYKGLGRGRYSLWLLIPAFTYCIWLIAAYQVRAGDPVQLDYVYELFAIITSLLGLYFFAGFSFEKGRPALALLCSMLGVYFSLTTLADGHDWGAVLLYGSAILYLLASSATLLYNTARPHPRGSDENDTEGISDEL